MDYVGILLQQISDRLQLDIREMLVVPLLECNIDIEPVVWIIHITIISGLIGVHGVKQSQQKAIQGKLRQELFTENVLKFRCMMMWQEQKRQEQSIRLAESLILQSQTLMESLLQLWYTKARIQIQMKTRFNMLVRQQSAREIRILLM